MLANRCFSPRYGILTDELPVHKQIMLGVFKIAGKLPFVASYKAKELKKVQESFQHDMIKHPAGYKVNKTLPAVGLSKELLFEQLSQLAGVGEPEARLNAGKVTGTVYVKLMTRPLLFFWLTRGHCAPHQCPLRDGSKLPHNADVRTFR